MAYRAVELAFIFAPSVLLGILSLAFPSLRDTFAAWATSAAERAGVCFIKLAQVMEFWGCRWWRGDDGDQPATASG